MAVGGDVFVFAEDNEMTSVSERLCLPFHPCVRLIFCLKAKYKMRTINAMPPLYATLCLLCHACPPSYFHAPLA